MDRVLEGYLFQMHSGTCSDMREKMKDIKDIVSKANKCSVLMALMDTENGLISLLSKLRFSKKEENAEDVIKDALLILGDLLEKFGESLNNHLVVIKNSALVYLNSKNSMIRGASYFVLCQVVIAAQTTSTEILEKLNLPALSNMLFEKMAASSDDNSSKAKMYFLVLLGRLAQYFPCTLKEKASRIIYQILYELEKEVKRQPDYKDKLVGGCIEALTGFLHSFNSILDQNCREKIHGYLLMLITRFLLVDKRVHTKKAALNMLAEHGTLFNDFLLKHCKSWFDILKSYALFEKTGVLENGMKALEKFIKEVVKSLKVEVDTTRKTIIIEFFVKSVIEILESDQASLELRGVSLKALGESSFLVSGTNVSHIFEYLLNKTTCICIQEDTSKTMDLFPICLESLGLVLMHYTVPIGIGRTQQLQKMLVHLFSCYLDIAEKNQCGRSIAVFLVGASTAVQNPLDFSDFVREFVIQSLIRSTRPELDSDSIKKYASLWVTILNFSRQTDLPFSLENRVRVSEVLDVQLVTATSAIIGRLNFTVNENDDSTVDEEKSCPQNPADWQLFHNLVDLLEDLFKAVEPKERLKDLLIPFGGEVVELSTKFPLVPGLYRILASVLLVIGADLPIVHHPHYQYYMSSLINRLAQLSNDVLVSAIQAVLASPSWLVTSLNSSVTDALASALKIGLTYPPMAEWPLNALEHWQTTLSFSCFEPIMENILPFLEPYLSSVEKLTKEVPFISGKRFTPSKENTAHTIDREVWANIQRRVVKLLGRMGPKCSSLVHQNEDQVIAHSATGWQISGHLEFGLPLSDMKPVIQLDAFLPRILHLVQHTNESETRMAACEFLHASIVFLTGTLSRRTEEMKKVYPLTPLYSKIFPVILNLAVDSEEVIRQLFNGLLIQLVHWFARPAFCQKMSDGRRTILGEETILLLEQLMESACSGLDTSLVRDLACDCLLEFLKWNIKQTSNEILWEDPAAPDFLFQKLRSSATHPSPHQRLGAAIVLNKLYRVMRESEPLTSIYTLDLLTHFVVCLSLAEQDPPSLGTVNESKKVLYNLMRTVILRRNLFENPDKRRRVAPFMIQGTLSELLEIFLQHIFGSQQYCRRICVELCEILARPQSLTEVITLFLSRHLLENLLPCKFPLPVRLDVYRILLQLDVINTSKCDTDINTVNQFEVFVKKIEGKLKEKSTSVEVPLNDKTIIENFTAWTGFLTEYLRKSQSYTFLRVETLVRASLLLSRLGFNFNTGASRKQLYTCLETEIFPLLKQHDAAIRSVLTSGEFQLDCLDFSERNSLDILQGLILITSSGCMGANVSYCKSPTVLLKMAVDNIVSNDVALLNKSEINVGSVGSDSFSVRLKSSSMLIELALLIGLNIEILANEFRNPASIPNSAVTYGQYLRTKLGNSVFPVLVVQIKTMQPFLPQTGNSDSQQWTLLLELLLQVAHQSQDCEKKKWIVQNVLNSWSVLERHAEDYRQKGYLQSIVNCIANIDVDLVGRNNEVKRWIISSWNPSTDVNVASEMVLLLNIFVANCSESEEKSLTSSMQQFFTHNFPSKTTGLEKDSDKANYFSIFNRMIGMIRVPVVFHFLVDVFVLEPRHSCVPSFIQSVKNEDWTKSPCGNSLNRALTKLYQYAKNRAINPKTRIDEIEIIYVPLLTVLPSSVVELHLDELLADVLQMYEDTRTGIESFIQKTVLCALLAVAIVRVDYQRLSIHLNANFCALKKTLQLPDDGKSLNRCLMQFVLTIRKLVVPTNDNEVEIFENLERFAFKLMLSIGLVTPSFDEERLNLLIFKPMCQKITLWNAAVGTLRKYNLSVEVERHRKRFRVYIPTISTENRENKGYIPSQFLFGSSLSEDVYRFDFNQASFSTNFGSYDETRNASTSQLENEEMGASSSSLLYLTLDDLNKHPCMGLLVSLLEKMYSKQTVIADSEPEWMNHLRETLLNSSAHTNVVLFIVRLVINLKSIFQPYAKFWYKSLLIALFRKIGGEPLNSLFRDGLDMMLEWSKEKPPSVDDVEFAQAASSVLQFTLKNIDNANLEILRDNMEMLKAIFCVWDKISLNIPYEIVEEALLSSGQKKAKLGLLILDVIVVHGFFPNNHERNSRFKQVLANFLKLEEKRDFTRSCAALCGSILFRETDKEFEKLVCDALQSWHHKKKDDVFIDLLHDVGIRYRGVLSKFAGINLSLLGSLHGGLKARCLEILAVSWNFLEDPWKEIGLKTIESILKGSEAGELCPVLSLVKDLIPRLEIREWKPLWPTLIRLSRHGNIECRSRLYEVFKKAFDLSDPRDPEFAQAILRSCTDQDKELANKMQNFLAEKLPDSTMDRLLVYLTDFYSPGSEEYFLPYSSHFLLERTTHSHLYRESIFDQPLDDIPFQLLDLASLSSQSVSQRSPWKNFGRGFSYGSIQPGFLRATQSTVSNRGTFPPTPSSPANWLMAETQSGGPSFAPQVEVTASSQNLVKESFKSPLKSWKRFTSTGPPPVKLSYENRSKGSREASSQPVLYRKYRAGELPDIQIPSSSLIAPLCVVALNDPATAKSLFCHLLSALRRQIKEIQGDDREFALKINAALESILERHQPRNSSFNLAAAIMEYFWTNSVDVVTHTEKLVKLVKASHLQSLGILVIESCLPDCLVLEQCKKPRLEQVKPQSSGWFHVADLYGDIQNVDNVRAVVTYLTDCKDTTKKAIASESKHDWNKAFQYYSQALGDVTSPTVEMEFCREYGFKCLEQLGRWDEIGRLKPKTEPWNIRSHVRNSLQIFQTSQAVKELDIVNLHSVDPALLTDLAALALRNGNRDRAVTCISQATDELISRYSQLSTLNFGGRQNLLQHVCIITEIEAFLNQSDITTNVSLPQSGDNIVVWDSILALRTFFAQCEKKKTNLVPVESLRLQLAGIALEQKNVGLARTFFNGVVGVHEPAICHRYLMQSKILAMESLTFDAGLNQIGALISAKETINRAVKTTANGSSEEVSWGIDRERFEASLCAQVFQVINNMQPKDLVTKEAKLLELWNVQQPREIIEKGLQHTERHTKLAEIQGDTTKIAEAHIILAKYLCKWKANISDEDYNIGLTRSVLASMRYGSVDGQALFPLVILAVKDNSSASAAFQHLRSNVPTFMFLPWVNQLVSYFALSSAIAKLLIEISERHPLHVKLPFAITRSTLSLEVLEMYETRTLEANLTMHDPTWKLFLKSLDYLKPPEKAAMDLLNSETWMNDFELFKSLYLNLPPPTATSSHGHVHHSFSVLFTSKFQEAFSTGRLSSDLANLLKSFKKETLPGRRSLRDYSPWLANYRIGDNFSNGLLELPVLKGKTLKVEAVRDEIQYIHSKQFPVRLTFIVNGGMEYPVLIKHGEDVRQDERIIQLLNAIDVALMRDIDSKERSLRIRTFQVIPLTNFCGLFQWLTDTLTLKAFLNTDFTYHSSSIAVAEEICQMYPTKNVNYFMNTTQEKLMNNYSKLADRSYRYGLRGALKKLSQSPEAFFYLRNRLAASHGTLCSALWTLGVGDRHLSNFLVSTKTGDIISIDYGMAFGTATNQLAVPEVVPCRLTTQFQHLIPGLGLNGPIRESMIHTLRVIKEESGSIIAALSIFVTEPTLDWLKRAETMATHSRTEASNNESTDWSPVEVIQRTENLLNGSHPSKITCDDLKRNTIFSTAEGRKLLPVLVSVVQGTSDPSTVAGSSDTIVNKRRIECYPSRRASMPKQELSSDQQVECLIDQSTDPACLSRMYWGWESWM